MIDTFRPMRGAAPGISIGAPMEQYDQDLDELLDEIPRATSAADADFLPRTRNDDFRKVLDPIADYTNQVAIFGAHYHTLKNAAEFRGREGSWEQESMSSISPDRDRAQSFSGGSTIGSPERTSSSTPEVVDFNSVRSNHYYYHHPDVASTLNAGYLPYPYGGISSQYDAYEQHQAAALQYRERHQRFMAIQQQRDHLLDGSAAAYEMQLQQAFLAAAVGPPDAAAGVPWNVYRREQQVLPPELPGSVCRYFAQGYCSRGDYCPFLHQARHFKKPPFAARRPKPTASGKVFGYPSPTLSRKNGRSNPLVEEPVYTSLEDVDGRILEVAKDQHGCRFLQQRIEEGNPDDLRKIFDEIIDHIIDLMTSGFGNYMVQKLLQMCTDAQRMEILRAVQSCIVDVSLNMHGTRAIQKLIDTLQTDDEAVAILVSSLKNGVVTLTKDSNGNHVVQRCLHRLSSDDSQFIYDAIAKHCVEIAKEKHGCCVLQRCVDFANVSQKGSLAAEIAANAHILSIDEFGNYVVQYVIEVMPSITMDVVARLEGRIARLAMNKYGSNVVEKCLEHGDDGSRANIVRELISSPLWGHVLQDKYGNYVVQSALTNSKGTLYTNIVEAIRPQVALLRSSPYGKRILSRTNLRR